MSRRHSEGRWPVPGVATRYPFAAGWTVSEHPNYDPRVQLEPSIFCSAVKCCNHLAIRPSTEGGSCQKLMKQAIYFYFVRLYAMILKNSPLQSSP